MTITTIYLIDSRLSSKRAVQIQVQLFRIEGNKIGHEPNYGQFSLLAADKNDATPLNIELDPGGWLLAFTSSMGKAVAYTFNVPVEGNVYIIDAALLEGYQPSVASKHMNYELMDSFNEKAARGFVASSTNARRVENLLHSRNSSLNSKLQITYKVFEFCNKHDRNSLPVKRDFTSRSTFNDKLSYWFDGWRSTNENRETSLDLEFISGKEFCTGRVSVRNSFTRPKKIVLYISFADERYLLIVPCRTKNDDLDRSDLDIEIDFYDTTERACNGRISQVRAFTDNSAFNGIAQQLSKGNLQSANQLSMYNAERFLREKNIDQVAATVGALVLVQPDIPGNLKFLQSHPNIGYWIGNLRNQFEWISEGSIFAAWILGISRSGKSEKDEKDLRKEIAELLIEAINRGIPSYSESLSLLCKGVEWASEDIPLDTRLALGWLALNSINASPFLLLHDKFEDKL